METTDAAASNNSIEVGFYFGVLMLTSMLGSPGGIAGIPVRYFLKDQLHARPMQMAAFGAITLIPVCLGFLAGFLRDRWRPRGLGDRGYLLMAAPVAILAYLWLASGKITYYELIAATLLAVVAYVVIVSAAQALMTYVAQEQSMTGELSAVWNVAVTVPGIIATLLGGWLVQRVSAQGTFLIAAGITAVIFVQAFWKPQAIFAKGLEKVPSSATLKSEILRLVRHRPLWPAALILFLWDFSPGWQTPMFYHLTETVKISSQGFGVFSALITGMAIPTTILYGAVCRRAPLKKLLWWGTIFAIVQGPVALFAQSSHSAIAVAIIAGLLGGFGTAAYFDLLIRACPKGLEGTAYMLALSGVFIATGTGDLFGSWLYLRGGFTLSIIATTIATTLILPVLFMVPRDIVSTKESETAAELEREDELERQANAAAATQSQPQH